MPAPLAPFVAFALGIFFAWVASFDLVRLPGSVISSRSMAVVVLFACLIYGPLVGYFLTYATDWSLAYLIDGRRVPSALLLVLVLIDVALVIVGFVVGASQVRSRRETALLPLFLVPMALAAVVFGVLSRRLSLAGTYAQIHRGLGATPLAGSFTGQAVLWFLSCFALGVLFTARELRVGSRSNTRRS